MEQLTVTEAATRLGVSVRRVQAMVKAGSIPATRFGKAIAINEADLSLVTTYGKPGRPPKAKPDAEEPTAGAAGNGAADTTGAATTGGQAVTIGAKPQRKPKAKAATAETVTPKAKRTVKKGKAS